VENTVYNSTSIFACISVGAGAFFTEPLPTNGSGMLAYIAVIA
jgi:hypothetical protein